MDKLFEGFMEYSRPVRLAIITLLIATTLGASALVSINVNSAFQAGDGPNYSAQGDSSIEVNGGE